MRQTNPNGQDFIFPRIIGLLYAHLAGLPDKILFKPEHIRLVSGDALSFSQSCPLLRVILWE